MSISTLTSVINGITRKHSFCYCLYFPLQVRSISAVLPWKGCHSPHKEKQSGCSFTAWSHIWFHIFTIHDQISMCLHILFTYIVYVFPSRFLSSQNSSQDVVSLHDLIYDFIYEWSMIGSVWFLFYPWNSRSFLWSFVPHPRFELWETREVFWRRK